MNLYLERYSHPTSYVNGPVPADLKIIVTIPSYAETSTLEALKSIANCEPIDGSVEVITVINHSDTADDKIRSLSQRTFQSLLKWSRKNSQANLAFKTIYVDNMPAKHAGVGMARKIAMDEAVRRFEHINKVDGIIACFDADCTCQPNYLQALFEHFRQNPKSPGCSIYYEHLLGNENSEAIVYYELFLRYYVHAMRWVGLPYAYQTVGSSMAVSSWAYQRQGGMNRRKAGEDFYFLHRIIALGGFTEVRDTKVIPSSRQSDRVPFGTGRSMIDWEKGKKDLSTCYNPQIFEDLAVFIEELEQIYLNNEQPTFSKPLQEFFIQNKFVDQLKRFKKQSNNLDAFRKNFFQWFNGFLMLKYVHYSRDHHYPNVSLLEAMKWLSKKLDLTRSSTAIEYLEQLRLLDQKLDEVKQT